MAAEVYRPVESPLKTAYQAAEAVAGLADARIKANRRLEELDQASTSQPEKRSPLARILTLRLLEAYDTLSPLAFKPGFERQTIPGASEDQLHTLTAETAFICLDRIHAYQLQSKEDALDRVGAKDRKTINILISLVSQWGFGPTLLEYDAVFAQKRSGQPTASKKPSGLSHEPAVTSESSCRDSNLSNIDQQLLNSTKRLGKQLENSKKILVSNGRVQLDSYVPSQMLQPGQLLASQVYAAAARLAYGPKLGGSGETAASSHAFIRLLLNNLSASAVLPLLASSLQDGDISSGQPSVPTFVRQISIRFLSAQLLRREGVIALITSTVGSQGELLISEGNAPASTLTPTQRLNKLAVLLTTPPPAFDMRQFLLQHTSPVLIDLVTGPPGLSKAAAYVFAKMSMNELRPYLSDALASIIWKPWLPEPPQPIPSKRVVMTTASDLAESLAFLVGLVSASPPLSEWLRWLLDPIITRLWELLDASEKATALKGQKILQLDKLSDQGNRPSQKSVALLVQSWLGVADEASIFRVFDSLSLPQGSDSESQAVFHFDGPNGDLCWGRPVRDPPRDMDLASLVSRINISDLTDAANGVRDVMPAEIIRSLYGSIFDARVDPQRFVKFLFTAKRSDVAAAILPTLLERYLSLKAKGSREDETTGRLLHYMQTIAALLDTFGEGIVKHDAARALRFVHFCLVGKVVNTTIEQTSQPEQSSDTLSSESSLPLLSTQQPSDAMAQLRNVTIDNEILEEPSDGNSEVTEEDADPELSRTALDLLLSILEQQQNMTTTNTPLLAVIERTLASDRLASNTDEEVRRLVREAKLALFARREAFLRDTKKKAEMMEALETPAVKAKRKVEEIYQNALKLLQDPILPVRAHGLVMLRDLIASNAHPTSDLQRQTDAAHESAAVEQLIEPITDVLLEAVKDEESYLYLNAIKGLKEVAMRGHTEMRRLVKLYSAGPRDENSSWTAASVDFSLHVGEALLQAVQHLASGGSKFIDEIVPPLCRGLQTSSHPTTLRASFLSLLGTCVEAFPLAMVGRGYASRLAQMVLEILKVEMVSRSSSAAQPASEGRSTTGTDDADSDSDEETVQLQKQRFAPGADDAVGVDASYPQLRRGALLLLCLLIRGARHQLEDDSAQQRDRASLNGTELRALKLPGGSSLPSIVDLNDGASPTTRISGNKRGGSLLFEVSQSGQTRTVAAYVKEMDNDALVRHQADEVLSELDALELAFVHC